MSVITDGSGKANRAKVDDKNRLSTESVTISHQSNASIDGDSYQIGSGVVVLTSTCESGVLYFKNNETRNVILTAVNITTGASAGSSAPTFLVIAYLSATGLSCGVSKVALNNNFGSNKSLCADISVGVEGSTITNGIASGSFYIPIGTFFNTDIAWIIPQGVSVAVSVIPPAGNTSLPLTITLEGHLHHD